MWNVVPAVRWRVSTLPAPSCGGNGTNEPSRSGQVPIVPQNGVIGISTPGTSVVVDPPRRSNVRTKPSGKSSGRSPSSGRITHQPQSPVSSERISTDSVSPGFAPSTWIGPARL